MFYAGETGRDEGDVWVGAFGGGGTDSLVGTSSAGVSGACESGLGTGAVFRFRGDERRCVLEGGREIGLDGSFEGGRHDEKWRTAAEEGRRGCCWW